MGVVPEAPTEEAWTSIALEETRKLLHLSWHLRDLADAFYATGNTIVAEQLADYASDIYNAQETISKQVARGLNEAVNQSLQSSSNMLAVALAVSENYTRKE